MTKLDRDLDRVLAGRSDPDEALVGLVETARALTQAFDLEPEPAIRERALFAAGVGARGRSGLPLARLFAPVAAGLGLVAALGFASGTAMPGDVLYPVRKVLQDVGLNEGVLTDATARMDRAEALLDEAEDLPNDRGDRVTTLAVRAIQELAPVEDLLEEADLSSGELAGHRGRLAALIARGTSLIAANVGGEGSAEDDGRSGSGDGDEDGDDSSGSGSGDGDEDGDDSSGSGSDDGDDDGDDSSGSGSDDGDDRSGSGDGDDDRSGSDGDREDSSGSGSDENDSSGDGDGDREDSSGSGSDDESDSSGSGDGEDRSGSDDDPIDSLDDRELDDDESGPDAEDSLD